jgi:hypothetical protein
MMRDTWQLLLLLWRLLVVQRTTNTIIIINNGPAPHFYPPESESRPRKRGDRVFSLRGGRPFDPPNNNTVAVCLI